MNLYCIRFAARSRNPFRKSFAIQESGVYISRGARALKKLARRTAEEENEYFFSVSAAHVDVALPFRKRFAPNVSELLMPLCGEILSYAAAERGMDIPLDEIFLMMDAPKAITAARILEEYSKLFTIVSPVPSPHGEIDSFYSDTGIAVRHVPTLPKRYRGSFAVIVCEMSEYVSPLIRAPIIDLRREPLARESVFSKYNIAFEAPSELWRLVTLWGGTPGADAIVFFRRAFPETEAKIASYHTKTDDIYTLCMCYNDMTQKE
ncbi:MAG: hypothetical protein Q4C12_08170 [Clostridia bacterium]|nr:hypothetical protein [Clostridia bacterium]